MLHEERVERDPVARVDRLAQSGLRFLGRPRSDDTEPVRDAVDVGVDRYAGDPVAKHENAVGGLRADARERLELGDRAGDLPAEPLEQFAGALPDRARFRAVESDRPDERLDLRGPGRGERPHIREPGEQRRGRDVGLFVPGPLGEDRADEDLERVGRVVAEVGSSPVARAVERGEAVEDRLPVGRREGPGGHALSPFRWRSVVGAAAEWGGGPSPGSERSGSSTGASERRSSPMR